MKKLLLISVVAGLIIAGCSSVPKSGMRNPDSKVFNCHFEEKVEGKSLAFDFTPEDSSLVIGETKLAMIESDFVTGGFVYRSSKAEKDFDARLEFISYANNPVVKVILGKSPYSKNPLVITHTCSN